MRVAIGLMMLVLYGTCVRAQAVVDPTLARLTERLQDQPLETLAAVDSLLRTTSFVDSTRYVDALEIRARANIIAGNSMYASADWELIHAYSVRNGDGPRGARAAAYTADLLMNVGRLREAQRYLLEAVDYYDHYGTPTERADVAMSLAILYNDLGRHVEAEEAYRRALQFYLESDDLAGQTDVHGNLALHYLQQDSLDRAEYHLLQKGALDTLIDDTEGLGFFYDYLAILRSEQGRLEEALREVRKGKRIREGLPDRFDLAESWLTESEILQKLGRSVEAREEAERVLAFAGDNGLLHQESYALLLLSTIYDSLGDPGQALTYHRLHKETADSIYREDQLREIAEQNAVFETDRRNDRIAVLDRSNAANADKLERTNTALVLAVIGLCVLSLFALTIWWLFRNNSKQAARLGELNEQQQVLLRETHHRVKNNLQLISSILALQSHHVEDPAALEALAKGQQRVRSMAIIHQRLYLRNAVTTELDSREYLQQLTEELTSTLNVDDLDLELDLQLEAIPLDLDRMISLGLIVNELVTNVIKHAFPGRKRGRLTVSFRQLGSDLVLRVADDGNGKGSDSGGTASGERFGWQLVRMLVEQLDGKLRTKASTQGTEIIVRLPAKRK